MEAGPPMAGRLLASDHCGYAGRAGAVVAIHPVGPIAPIGWEISDFTLTPPGGLLTTERPPCVGSQLFNVLSCPPEESG